MAKAKTYEPTTGKSLREIVEERQVLDVWLQEQDGELTPELDALMRDQDADEKRKIEAVGYYIAEEEEEIEAIKRQIARLVARRQAKENRIDWLKNRYLAEMLMKLGYRVGDAVKGALATVRIQLNNPRLGGSEIDDNLAETMYNDPDLTGYINRTVTYPVDRVALLSDAKVMPELKAALSNRYGVRIVRDESVRIA
jgi:hypothetical protein